MIRGLTWERLPLSLLDYSRLMLSSHGRHHRLCSTSCASASPLVRAGRSSKQGKPKLRFAPSPTGHLHLGGLRTALYNYLLARQQQGTWILRIEDTDQTRAVTGAVESLLRVLKWAGLNYDEGPEKDVGNGPYYQSQRSEIYNRYIQSLFESNRAYHCFCSPERLALTRKRTQKLGDNMTYDRKCLSLSVKEVEAKLSRGERSVVRFKSTSDGMIQQDLVYNAIRYESLPVEDFVLRKSDGLPTYHFASVIDDHSMGVTHVIRGEEWLPSTPKHFQLYAALGLDPPAFAHLPLLINSDGSKLSKRAGDVRVEDYIERGYEPEALLNFVALMGWSPQAVTEANAAATSEASHVLTVSEMIDKFSLEGVNKNRSIMSIDKLNYLNREHVKLKLDNHTSRQALAIRLGALVKETFKDAARADDLSYLASVIEALKERLYTLKDIPNLGPYFFLAPDYESKTALKMYRSVSRPIYCDSLRLALAKLNSLSSDGWSSHDALVNVLNELIRVDQSSKELMVPLRHALTGARVGAGVPMTLMTLGREESLQRLTQALHHASIANF